MRVYSWLPEDRYLPRELDYTPSEVVDPTAVSIYWCGKYVCDIFPHGPGEVHLPRATLVGKAGSPGFYRAYYGEQSHRVL